jgi:ABC-type Mn2+/Zn2+ transport system ATPase subunit
MAGQLKRFRINRLHGARTLDVEIQDNRLILVGENGTGKSTVVNFIYFVLTEQWGRMAHYDFDSMVYRTCHRRG